MREATEPETAWPVRRGRCAPLSPKTDLDRQHRRALQSNAKAERHLTAGLHERPARLAVDAVDAPTPLNRGRNHCQPEPLLQRPCKRLAPRASELLGSCSAGQAWLNGSPQDAFRLSCDAERMRIVQSGSDREDLLGADSPAAGMLL